MNKDELLSHFAHGRVNVIESQKGAQSTALFCDALPKVQPTVKCSIVSQPLKRFLDDRNDDIYVFSVHQPIIFLANRMQEWYEQGGINESFAFFHYFKKHIDTFELQLESEVEALVAWIATVQIQPLFNPQIAYIDPKKNVNDAKKIIQAELDVMLVEEEIVILYERFGMKRLDKVAGDRSEGFLYRIIMNHAEKFTPLLEKDIWLYEQAKVQFARFVSNGLEGMEERRLAAKCKGVIGNIGTHAVAGWAEGPGGETAELILIKNGKEVARVVADQPREDLRQAGIHVTGICGFVFNVPPPGLSPTDSIEVRFAKYDAFLEFGEKAKKSDELKEDKVDHTSFRGIVGNIGPRVVTGWAEGASGEIVELVLIKNGKEIERRTSNILREDLRQAGIHPTGVCGFVFEVPEPGLLPTDNIEVRFVESGAVLELGEKAYRFFKHTSGKE